MNAIDIVKEQVKAYEKELHMQLLLLCIPMVLHHVQMVKCLYTQMGQRREPLEVGMWNV